MYWGTGEHTMRNGWNAMLPARVPRPTLSGQVSVDHAVIGARFTGLAVARRLRELQPEADIMMSMPAPWVKTHPDVIPTSPAVTCPQ